MIAALHRYCRPLRTLNRRISVGAGVLMLVLLGQCSLAFAGRFT